ncbi:MAG: two-component system, chemotaxis family, CheB/CheR fusion protein, partial [Solirubrobacteraceae bacterium]|nr:two-component system, chemotaxis family, CheB/CheR fusion protein [Solirubrobacteraceae bacterium]
RFHFALDDAGLLLLGKSEMLVTHADIFRPADVKRRLFQKVVRPTMRDRVRVMATEMSGGPIPAVADKLRDAAYDVAIGAQLVIDREGRLVMANDLARRTLGVVGADIGRNVFDLEVSYRPVELRARLERIGEDRTPISIDDVRWKAGAQQDRVFEVRLVPVIDEGELLGTSISYIDVTDVLQLRSELTDSRRELEEAHEELQSTVEELETTNEELQSTNEELETTNEELQSTNEELETMNEELQSTNEELETMNDELRQRTFELNDVNTFLETILTTIGLAVVVLDSRQQVRLWNKQARELWGLSAEEVDGHHLLGLEIGLPVEQLKPMLKACFDGSGERQDITLDAVNRRGKAIRCRVTCMPLTSPGDGEVTGIIVMMEPESA